VEMIRGKQGTVVRLAVTSVGSPEKKVYAITRAKIELTDSEARSHIFDEGRKPDGTPYKVGVIDLPSFYMDMEGARQGKPDYKSTTRDVRLLLDDFKKKGVDLVVLDLRRNGGGSLQEAINLSGLFLNEGPVVQVKDPEGRVQPYYDFDSGMAWSGPLIVVTSKFSASASEILAGAIQDYHRGLIVGDHSTHGKGTVQSLMDLGEHLFRPFSSTKLGALKVTMQQFYRPSGDSTQQRGVVADVELPSITTWLEELAEADLPYSIAFDRVPAAEFQPFAFVTKAIVDRLNQLSQARCAKSPDFERVRREIAQYQVQKKRKWVPLQEAKFLEERAEMNVDKEEEKRIEEMSDPNAAHIKRDFYLNEVLAIAVDYLRLLGAGPAPQAAQAATPAQ
jgi:carboxyl-terminal processing protease